MHSIIRIAVLALFSFPLSVISRDAGMDQLIFEAAGSESAFGGPLDPMKPSGPSLTDIMTVESGMRLFYDYLRDSTSVSERLLAPLMNTTLFVPRNSAILSLSRKPHEGPSKSDTVLVGEGKEKADKQYVEDWVKSHIVPENPISLTPSDAYDTLLSGRQITFETVQKDEAKLWVQMVEEDWQKVRVNPGQVRIVDKKQATNGVIYVLDGVLSHDL